MVYLSQDSNHNSFTETLNLWKFDSDKTLTAGMNFLVTNGSLLLKAINKSTPSAQIQNWRSCTCHTWLIQVNWESIITTKDVSQVLQASESAGIRDCKLLFAHPQIVYGLTNNGIP